MLNDKTMSVTDSLQWIQDNTNDGTPPRIRNKKLPIKNIEVNLEVFQCRSTDSFGEAQKLSSNHIKELRERLQTEELDAITIFNVGGTFFVIDGHHRLKAYQLERKKQIPVTVFKGNAKDALLYGVKENSKSKISLTKEQRSELCWRFIIEDGGMSKSETANAFSVSERLVAYMRKRYKELGTNALELKWWETKRTKGIDEDRGTSSKEEYLSKELYKLLGAEIGRDTRVVARALARMGSYRYEQLLHSMQGEDERGEKELNYLKVEGDIKYALPTILAGLEKQGAPKTEDINYDIPW